MRVALVSLESYYDNSLALDYLASWIGGQSDLADDVQIAVFVHPAGQPTSELFDRVSAWRPDLVGFSCYLWNIGSTLEFVRAQSRQSPRPTVVLGGMEATYQAEHLLSNIQEVDFIVQGEGEIVFAGLIRSLLRDQPIAQQVPGIAYRKEGGRVVAGGLGPAVIDLDSVPSPFLASSFVVNRPKRILYESYRGCAFHCSFCLYRRDYSTQRYLSAERVRTDLQAILEVGVEHIRFVDATFNLHRSRTKEILRQLRGKGVDVAVEVSAEFFDEEMISLFPPAGICHVDIGLQSTKDAVLQAVKRDFYRPDRFDMNIARLSEQSELRLNIELIAGLPSDNLEGFTSSLQEAVTRWPDHVSMYRLLGLPGTPLERDREALGLIFAETPPYELLRSSTFSHEDLCEVDRIAFSNLLLFNSEVGRYALRHCIEGLSAPAGEIYHAFHEYSQAFGGYSKGEILRLGRHHTHGNRSFELLPDSINLERVRSVSERFFIKMWRDRGRDDEALVAAELVDFGYQLATLNSDLATSIGFRTRRSKDVGRPRRAGSLRHYQCETIAELQRQGCGLGRLEPQNVGGVLFFEHLAVGPAALAVDQSLAAFLRNPETHDADSESVAELRSMGVMI